MSKLKKCPFCGGEARMHSRCNDYETDNFVMHFVRCDNCKAESVWCREGTDAINAWNNRKPLERVIERLEEKERECRKMKEPVYDLGMHQGLKDAIDIIKEEVDGWQRR